jgi:hypothetical protein
MGTSSSGGVLTVAKITLPPLQKVAVPLVVIVAMDDAFTVIEPVALPQLPINGIV